MPDNDSGFPPPIATLAYRAVTLRSELICRLITCLSFDIDTLKGVYTIFSCHRYAVFALYQITCAGFQIVFRYIVYHDIVLSGGFVLALINMHDTAEAFKFLSPIPLLAYFRRIAQFYRHNSSILLFY